MTNSQVDPFAQEMLADQDVRKILQPKRPCCQHGKHQGVSIGDALDAALQRRRQEAIKFGDRRGVDLTRGPHARRLRLLRPGVAIEGIAGISQPAPVHIRRHRLHHDLETDERRDDRARRDLCPQMIHVRPDRLFGDAILGQAIDLEQALMPEKSQPAAVVLAVGAPGGARPMGRGALAIQDVAFADRLVPGVAIDRGPVGNTADSGARSDPCSWAIPP